MLATNISCSRTDTVSQKKAHPSSRYSAPFKSGTRIIPIGRFSCRIETEQIEGRFAANSVGVDIDRASPSNTSEINLCPQRDSCWNCTISLSRSSATIPAMSGDQQSRVAAFDRFLQQLHQSQIQCSRPRISAFTKNSVNWNSSGQTVIFPGFRFERYDKTAAAPCVWMNSRENSCSIRNPFRQILACWKFHFAAITHFESAGRITTIQDCSHGIICDRSATNCPSVNAGDDRSSKLPVS